MNLLNSFSFELPTKIEYGVGATGKLVESIKDLGSRKVMIVTDKGIEASGLLSGIAGQFTAARLEASYSGH